MSGQNELVAGPCFLIDVQQLQLGTWQASVLGYPGYAATSDTAANALKSIGRQLEVYSEEQSGSKSTEQGQFLQNRISVEIPRSVTARLSELSSAEGTSVDLLVNLAISEYLLKHRSEPGPIYHSVGMDTSATASGVLASKAVQGGLETVTTKTKASGEAPRARYAVGHRYIPLYKHLRDVPEEVEEVSLMFRKVEEILGIELPDSPRKLRVWWANETGLQSPGGAWLEAGWEVACLDQEAELVHFRRLS